MNEMIKVIDQREVLGKQFTVFGTIENPLFLAKDVAEWIDYAKTGQGHYDVSGMLRTVDDDEKTTINNRSGGKSTYLTEDGLYEILMQSRKPIAKEFKKQVKFILNQIRKHGAYMTPETIEKVVYSPDFLITIGTRLKEEQERRIELENVIEEQAPKVLLAETITASDSCISMGELAKLMRQRGYKSGRNRFFALLRDEGYLCSQGSDWNLPTQRSMDQGLFEIHKHSIIRTDGTEEVKHTPKVTGKGQLYFINKYCGPKPRTGMKLTPPRKTAKTKKEV